MSKSARYFTAQEAADELNIALPTLYAYVSRGLIRSEAGSGPKRSRRYHAEDVQQLKARKHYRRNPDKVAAQTLQAGAPILESAISLITDDCLYYRGHDALRLATNHTIEAVAALIWTGDLQAETQLFATQSASLSPRCQAVLPLIADLKPIERFQVILPLAAADDLAAYDWQADVVALTGVRILQLLTTIAVVPSTISDAASNNEIPLTSTIAQRLQRAWAPQYPEAQSLINAALVLCADHELNASAFTARCAASTQATPYAVVMAGLAALQGYKHGTASEQVEALFRELESVLDIRGALVDRLKRGDKLPGYGHIIYRDVDPRANLLQQQLLRSYPQDAALKLTQAIIKEANVLTQQRHNIDFILATLARVLQLPPGGAPALFALGRTIGWIGHAIEQYQLGQIIRPRARYVGPPPTSPAPRR